MSKKEKVEGKKKHRWWLVLLIIIVAIAALAAITGGGGGNTTPSPTDEPAATPEPTDEELYESVAKGVYGEDVLCVWFPDEKAVRLKFKCDNLTADMIVKGFAYNAADYLEKLCALPEYSKLDYSKVYFTGQIELQDEYGNVSNNDALWLTIDKTEVDKIQWDNFLPENIVDIGYDYKVSPALQ